MALRIGHLVKIWILHRETKNGKEERVGAGAIKAVDNTSYTGKCETLEQPTTNLIRTFNKTPLILHTPISYNEKGGFGQHTTREKLYLQNRPLILTPT